MKKTLYIILGILGALTLLACVVPIVGYSKWAVSTTMSQHFYNCAERHTTIPGFIAEYNTESQWKGNGGQHLVSLKDMISPCPILAHYGNDPVPTVE